MAGIFADDGISGASTTNQDDFYRIIRRSRQEKIGLILTKSISRFARNTLDNLKYIRAFRDMGIRIIFEKENINTLEMDCSAFSDRTLNITLRSQSSQRQWPFPSVSAYMSMTCCNVPSSQHKYLNKFIHI